MQCSKTRMSRHVLATMILLAVLILQCGSQNMVTGNARPCGQDNLSCSNLTNPDDPNDCLVLNQLCDGTDDCPTGTDEGNQSASLDCTSMMFRCTGGEVITLDLLCDGVNDCPSGADERSTICENKCLLPYYGGCEFTRECLSTEVDQNCGDCLTGYTPDLAGNPVTGPCLPIVFLTLDASTYDTSEDDTAVQVCVSGSVGTGDPNDIAGQSFEVNFQLFDGTAIGNGEDYNWTSPSTVTFDSTNVMQPQCVDIAIIDDDLVDCGESFSVILTPQNNFNGQIILQTSSAIVSIADNDGSCLTFIELGTTPGVSTVSLPDIDDESSDPIPIPGGFLFGGSNETEVYVITNGFLIFGAPDTDFSPSLFPSELSFAVAPFWSDVDISNGVGEIRYEVHNDSSDPVIAEVSAFLSQQQETVFQGEWLLVAEWRDVPEFGGDTSLRNTFQGILVTDGFNSYTIFTYQCGLLDWSDEATIGFIADASFFQNHPLSGSSNANDIACLNSPVNIWSNVIYQLDQPTAPVFSFQQSSYSVLEDEGQVTVCVEYLVGPTSLPDSVTVIVLTEDGETGRSGVDYVSANVSLEFDAPVNLGDTRCLNIIIIDDPFPSNSLADFFVNLNSPDDIALIPGEADIFILPDENDSPSPEDIIIRFDPDEEDRTYDVQVGSRFTLLCGSPGEAVQVSWVRLDSGTSQLIREPEISGPRNEFAALHSSIDEGGFRPEDAGRYQCTVALIFFNVSTSQTVDIVAQVPQGPGSIAFVRFSTQNLTVIAEIINRTLSVDIAELELNQVIRDIIAANLTSFASGVVFPDCTLLGATQQRAEDIANFWLRFECRLLEIPPSDTTEELAVVVASLLPLSIGSDILIDGSVVVSGDGFCDHNTTFSEVSGSYSWDETAAGGVLELPCMFGAIVEDEGRAIRQCSGSAIWQEPDLSGCIDILQLSPEVDSFQYSVDFGRRFSLSCNSSGPYAGPVHWLHEGEVVSEVPEGPAPSEPITESGQSPALGEGASSGDTASEHLPPLGDPTVLYTNSKRDLDPQSFAAHLITHPNFGASAEVEGEYTCVTVTHLGNFSLQIFLDVVEPDGQASFAILRFSIDTLILQIMPRDRDVEFFLAHLETLFLDQIPENPNVQVVVKCSPAGSRPVDTDNDWSRVQCNVSTFPGMSSPTDLTTRIEEALRNGLLSDLVVISTIRNSPFGFCDHDSIVTEHGNYTWTETEGGMTQTQSCALGPAAGVEPEEAIATRSCNSLGEWEEPELSRCITIVSSQFRMLQEMLMQEDAITEENYEEVAEELTDIVNGATENEEDQTTENLVVVLQIFNLTAALLSSPDTEVTIEEPTVTDFVEVLDDLQEWNDTVVQEDGAGSNVVQSFESIVTNFVLQENFTNLTVIGDNIVFTAERVEVVELQENGRSFSLARANGTLGTMVGDSERSESQLAPQEIAAAILPPSLFEQFANFEEVGLFFSLYEDPVLFPLAGRPTGNELVNTTVGSSVVAATVAGLGGPIDDLAEPVVIFLRLFEREDGNLTNPRCVSWDFTLAGGVGNWTAEGCTTIAPVDNPEVVECRCDHLTNFACLVDVCSRVEGCRGPSEAAALALDIISIIGVTLSLIGIILTITTLLIFKKLRQRDATKYHIQLCIALFCMLLVFVIGIDQTGVYEGCVTVSVLIHYFTLVAVMWMGAEATLMFQKLVIIFVQITTRYVVILSLVCWLVPIVPVIIPVAIDRDFSVSFEDDSEEIRFCFIGDLRVFFAAFLGPIFAILLFNLVIFIIVVVVLVRHTRNTMGRTKEEMNRKTAIRLLISITGVMFLFGLTWVFGALTVAEASLAFQILFALLNSFQGFFIFLFFVVFSKDAREAWMGVLTCGRGKTPWSTPSSQKFTSTTGRNANTAGTVQSANAPTTSSTIGHSTLGLQKSEAEATELVPMNPDLTHVSGDIGPEVMVIFDQPSLQANTHFDTSEVIENLYTAGPDGEENSGHVDSVSTT